MTIISQDHSGENKRMPEFRLSQKRLEAKDRAEQKAGPTFREAFTSFVATFAAQVENFLIEDCIAAYKRSGLPLPEATDNERDRWKGVGGITRTLLRKGVIVKTGHFLPGRVSGSPKAVYEKGLNEPERA